MPSSRSASMQRPQLLAHLRVQADGRLVEQHEARAVHERARDEQAPPHAAGQLVDLRGPALGEVGDLERPLDGGVALAAGHAVEVGEDEEVLLDGERHVEVVELRHDAALRAGDLGLLRQRVPEHLELALVGDHLRGQHPHRRRLARAVGAEQADARALGHVEVEAVDRRDRAVALRRRAGGSRAGTCLEDALGS